jgi:aconitate decarboxylase
LKLPLTLQDPVVDKVVAHIDRVAEHGVPEAVRSAAKTFMADTLAVGIAGSRTPWRGEILDTLAGVGGAEEATVLGGGEKLPLMHAAMLNAYQIHAQEFDCVHEGAVVHPMAASLPVLLGWAEREGGVSGARLIRAVAVAVDVGATLGFSRCWPVSMAHSCGTRSGSITGSAPARCRHTAKEPRNWRCRWVLPHAAR